MAGAKSRKTSLRSDSYAKGITKRGDKSLSQKESKEILTETALLLLPVCCPEMLYSSIGVQKEGATSNLGPYMLAFLLIVLIGSTVVQVYQSAKQGF